MGEIQNKDQILTVKGRKLLHHERLHNAEQLFMYKKMNPNISQADVIWTNETTGGKVYVGDIKNASDLE